MQKNRFLKDGVKAAIAVLLAAGMTLAAGGTVAAQDSQTRRLAAELAASLNAMTKGCAKASKDTVTLSKGIGLQKNLAVPAGVTLDLTKAALALGDGAVFTVNGTVNAKSEGIIVDSAAAQAALINGSGTINLKSKGRLLGIWKDKKLTLEGVTLAGLKGNNEPVVQVEGEFVMKSGKITGNSIYAKEGWVDSGGVKVTGGTFTMEGGAISGNSAKSDGPEDNGGSGGGGVGVWQNGVFTMKGGAISDNSTGGSGGGVIIGQGGTFIMEDGVISGNTSDDSRGGVAAAGTFIMKGGAITGNTVGGDGGGVGVFNGGAFTMEGGAIHGNTALYGGGVSVAESEFTLKGGRIQGYEDSDGFTGNKTSDGDDGWWCIALNVWKGTAKWGTGGVYTQGAQFDFDKGGPKAGGSNIVNLDNNGAGGVSGTLIAAPK